jgi:MtrB/PioB family decaheme-associated outer membrane protein
MAERRRHMYQGCIGLVSVAIGAVFATTPAKAQEVDTSNWACELCAPSHGWELDIEAGAGYVTDDEFRFGDYTGLDDDGLYGVGRVFGRYWSQDAHFLRLEGYRLGQDSRAFFVKGGKQSLYELRASYQGIPRRSYDDTVTPFAGSGNERLTLPSDWVRASSTQGMSELDNSLRTVKIKQDWDIYGAGITFTPTRRWAFDVDYQRTDRDGQDSYAGSFFFDSAQFARPIDYTTNSLETSVGYHADRWQVSLAYNGSFFDNQNSSLSWDNPYSPQAAGADMGQLALAPDNDAHQVTLAGSWLLPASTTVNGQLSLGRMRQDQKLLPYTTNAVIATSPLPRSRADAKVDTTDVNLRVTSSPIQKLTVEGELRYNERDNDTPEEVYDYVVTDLFVSSDPARNTAYDYQRFNYKLRGEYRVLPRTRLHAGYDYERFDRTRQERNHTRTDRVWARVNSQLMQLADLDIEVYTETRDGSSYNTIGNAPDPQNPLMRLYNMADRDRYGVRSYASLYTGERASLGLDLEYNKDKYDNSEIGLKDGSYNRLGFDAAYLFPRQVSTYAAFYREKIDSKQVSSQSFSNPDWFGKTDDKFYTGTVGLKYPHIIGRLGANVEYTHARSAGRVENETSGLESAFPKLRTRLHQLKLALDYPYTRSLSLKFGYMYEKFTSDNWALEGIGPDTVPNLLSLGADPYDYSNNVFFIAVRYMFDSRGQAGPRLPQ